MQIVPNQESIWKILLHDPRTETYATLLSEFPDIIKQLKDVEAVPRWTLWVPCEQVLKNEIQKIKKRPAEARRNFLEHLISPYEFPADELFYFRNVPLIHRPQQLNGRQLLRIRPIFRPDVGPTCSLGFGEAHILVPDITALNGRIHILSNIPPQPPTVKDLLRRLPETAFAMLLHAMDITNFERDLEKLCGSGSTIFAPTDTAFQKQGLSLKDLRTTDPTQLRNLLRSHIAPGRTLYSNILYDITHKPQPPETPNPFPRPVGHQHKIFDSALLASPIRIDIDRNKGLIEMRVNHGSQVISMDHLASNGVVHVIDSLIVSIGLS